MCLELHQKRLGSLSGNIRIDGITPRPYISWLSCVRWQRRFREWVCYSTHPFHKKVVNRAHIDQTVINGANIFFRPDFGIEEATERNEWILGVVNSAPYFSCALVACWLTDPLNRYFGRRGTIFITCAIASLTCFWQSFVGTWWHLLIARFVR